MNDMRMKHRRSEAQPYGRRLSPLVVRCRWSKRLPTRWKQSILTEAIRYQQKSRPASRTALQFLTSKFQLPNLLRLYLDRTRLDRFGLWHAQCQHAVLHVRFDLVGVDLFRQFERAAELAVGDLAAQRANLLIG